MLEAALDPRQLGEIVIFQHGRIARGECGAAGVDRCELLGVGIEQRDENRVGAVGVGHGLQPRDDALVSGIEGNALKVDRDLRAG
jgi:hypothetical protein